MRTTLAASLLRHAQQARPRLARRFASNEATQKKAQETLASAQANAGKAWEGTKKFLEPAGQKIGQMLGSYKQPLLYNLAVTREVIKQIYVAEGLQPPTIAAIKAGYQSLWSQASPATLRNLTQSGELLRVGVYGAQAYGIFKIGEMIGRRHVIGYELH